MKKIITKKILILIFIMLGGLRTYAVAPGAPDAGATTQGVPVLPTEPIDEKIILLGFAAILFGSYTIYKTYKPIKKASN